VEQKAHRTVSSQGENLVRRSVHFAIGMLALSPFLAAYVGASIGGGILHPARLNRIRIPETDQMLERTGATKSDFHVQASDNIALRGWKLCPPAPNGDWVILYHGVSDNRTGVIGHAEFLLRHGYCVVGMDSRDHGESGGDMATYGWKERYDTVAVVDALYASQKVRHLYALGVSMGGAIALESAAVEPRIEAVVAEASFADLREVSYDYAGLHAGAWLGKTLFRPASMLALHSVEKEGGFKAEDVSPKKAVAARAFPVLLICGTRDSTIPCRHAELIYKAAAGPKEMWIVKGAGHAAALGHAPAEYESRTIRLFEKYPKNF
jgi:alpha-beta hydrolase superfamily lysophospholipase